MTQFSLPSPGRFTESESEKSFRKYAKENTNTKGNFVRQLQVSPMFDLFKINTKLADASSSENSSSSNDPNEFRGTRVADAIDPTDGKTKTCNRTKTFDAFIHEQSIGVDQSQKPSSHSWKVTRAMAMLRSPFRKTSDKADKQQNLEDALEK